MLINLVYLDILVVWKPDKSARTKETKSLVSDISLAMPGYTLIAYQLLC